MKEKKILLLGLLFGLVIISISNLVVFGNAEEVTVTKWVYYKQDPTLNSYYEITLKYADGTTETYPGWCADSGVYVSHTPYQAILVSSCDLPSETTVYNDDEQWCEINYLMNKWNSGGYSGATWVDIQQVIWYYADFGSYDPFTDPVAPYNFDTSNVQDIIDDVDDNAPQQCEGPEYAIIIVPKDNPGGHQLLFFMVPEIPLGTLGAGLTMLSAFIAKRKRTRTQ